MKNKNIIKVTKTREFGGTIQTYEYKNGLTLSSIRHQYSYGFKSNLFEIAVFNKAGSIVYENLDGLDFSDGVIGYVDNKKLRRYIKALGKVKTT